jgi:subtilisin family serine protease
MSNIFSIIFFVLLLLLLLFNTIVVESSLNDIYKKYEKINIIHKKSNKKNVSNKINNKSNEIKNRYIVHLRESHTYKSFVKSIDVLIKKKPHLMNINKKIIHFRKLLHGLIIEGVPLEELESLPGALRVVPDTIKTIGAVNSWGLDRIDQLNLPLDNSYNPHYTGKNVDVYIVDTGLDTTHQEFGTAEGSSRVVENVYDAYGTPTKTNPGPDTDKQGHGTHCAGTVGGLSVGVSPGANLYGVKVLNDDGSGWTSDIVLALEWVAENAGKKNISQRSVVSMSLGGGCDMTDCSLDSLVIATENLIKNNITVAVAAGNEGCNACYGSPAAAPNAFNVGASDLYDYPAVFSNFGECIDIFAPGYDIVSACNSEVCDSTTEYQTMSGTSMACPHVAGVLAQLLEKKSDATNDEISLALSCDSSKKFLHLDGRDSSTRDLFLQVPKQDTPFGTCNLGEGCISNCSASGICLPAHQSINDGDNSNICHCDEGHYGNTCADSDYNACDNVDAKTKISLKDSDSDGWNFANYVITDLSTGLVADGAYDSLCYGSSQSRKYCLPNGEYHLNVSSGYYDNEVSFNICGVNGGAPFNGTFRIRNNGETCYQFCPPGYVLNNLTLFDSYGDGWQSAYFGTYNSDGTQMYGGTMHDGSKSIFEQCLPVGCNSAMGLIQNGYYPEEISYEICGFTATNKDIVVMCIDNETKECTASSVDPSPSPAPNLSPSHTSVPTYDNSNCLNGSILNDLKLYDSYGDGWNGAFYAIYNSNGTEMYGGTMDYGYETVVGHCFPIGMHWCSTIEIPQLGYFPEEISYEICGFTATPENVVTVCIDNDTYECKVFDNLVPSLPPSKTDDDYYKDDVFDDDDSKTRLKHNCPAGR